MAEEKSSQRQRARRIKDTRGRNVTQLDPVSMHVLRQRDAIDAETVRQLAVEIGVGWRL